MGSSRVSVSDHEPADSESEAKNDLRAAIRRLTLVLPPFLWCMGFVFSLQAGCDSALASSKATAFAISGLVGWAVALRIWRPSAPSWPGSLLPTFILTPMSNMILLQQMRSPWPFHAMVLHGLVVSTLNGAMLGLFNRFWQARFLKKRVSGPRAHPLSDDQIG